MKTPDNIPISEIASDASLADVITAVNKVIRSVNEMWESDEPVPPSQ